MVANVGEKLGPVLVTGASGFLGAWLCAALLRRGETVHAFDMQDNRNLLAALAGAELAASIGWTRGDITDAKAVDDVFERSGARAVVHLAALTIPACRQNPAKGAAVNILGHIHVLDAAVRRGIDKVLYTSSMAAHPRGTLHAPANIYGVTKRADEDISKVYFLDHGIRSIGLRPNVVYGFGRVGGETAAITEAIRAAARGEAYAMPFDGRMCFQYVGEIVEVMLRCMAAEPDRPIVSDITTRSESISDLVDAIRKAEPTARIALSDVQRPAPDIVLDDAPLRRLIGDWQAVSLEEGVRLTLEHYRSQGAGHGHPQISGSSSF